MEVRRTRSEVRTRPGRGPPNSTGASIVVSRLLCAPDTGDAVAGARIPVEFSGPRFRASTKALSGCPAGQRGQPDVCPAR